MAGLKGQSGGARPGAGRKPRTVLERAVTPGHHGRVLTYPMTGQVPVVAPIEVFDPPVDLTGPAHAVWLDLAPHAFAARTLTKGTARAFMVLCRNVALEHELAGDPALRGGANHRGILQRLDAELLRFNLSPCGKAIFTEDLQPQPAVNPLDK